MATVEAGFAVVVVELVDFVAAAVVVVVVVELAVAGTAVDSQVGMIVEPVVEMAAEPVVEVAVEIVAGLAETVAVESVARLAIVEAPGTEQSVEELEERIVAEEPVEELNCLVVEPPSFVRTVV